MAACYQDNGIDARIVGDEVRFDEQGTLTASELQALVDRCEASLIKSGVIPDPSAEGFVEATYALFEEHRDCLVSAGYRVPELVSFAVFANEPERFQHPLDSIRIQQGHEALQDAMAVCPPP